MEINHHDHASLYCDPEQCDVADCHGDAEVVVEKPLQEQSSAHRIDCREDEDERFGNRVKDQVQQQEDHEEDDWQNQLKTLFGAKFEFIFSRPLEGVICRQGKFVVDELVCLCDEATVIGVFEVDVDVSRQRTIFV